MQRSTASIQNPNPEKTQNHKNSVLVIDDDFDTLSLQKMVLETEGLQVFTAQSGEEALEVLSRIEGPNLILLDMLMDDMTGLEFMNLLEEKNPRIIQDVPIVIMTGLDRIPDCQAAGIIRKPADNKTYLQAVHHFIDQGHRLAN